MNPLDGLGQYLDRLERRLRYFAWTRGAAAVFGAALLLTVVIVAVLMMSAFPSWGLVLGRFALFLGIGAAIAVALVVPLMRMNRRRAAQQVEHEHPGFDQRLLTFTERSKANAADPFLPLLAEDALEIARNAEPETVIHKNRFLGFAGLGAAAASVLLWLMFWGPGVFGYGTSLLWGSYPKDQPLKPFYTVTVQPGSKTIRRNTDQPITASISGFSTSHASVWVQYASASKWEEAPMQQQSGRSGFAFLLVRVPEDVQYYVEAGGIKSPAYKLHTIDLPAVKNLRVTYTYPSWTGLEALTEDPGGDLRAVEGTVAKVEIQTDKALSNAQIVFDEGKPIDLDPTQNNRTAVNIPLQKDGMYHIAVMDHGELVRLTDDYFVEARKPGVPTVQITKPGKDAKVSPIEEVPVAVTAEDDYPLQEVELHYSVNGSPEKVLPLMKQKGVKKVDGSTLLSLEDFKLVPGDIVSIYATAKDGRSSAKTDMFFIQAVPFEFEYSQGQGGGGGGGGGGGDQEQQISEREKEIIAATFNQVNGDAKAKAAAAENGKYLSDTQAKLRDQARSLADRTKARQLDGSGAAFTQFVKEMELAVDAMTPASDKLKSLTFKDALPPEQQALQHLLRAESTFRQIQVQVSRGGGGGGGGGGAGRDLANLFDLELDKDKNQYETNASSAAEQKQQQVDEALKKLEELARRQKELADQQQSNPQQMAQQRYQQEMLRREAEELKRNMEALQRGDQNQQGQQSQGQQPQQGQSNGQGQQSASGSSSQQGQPSARNQQQQSGQQQSGMSRSMRDQLDQAIRNLDQAEREMGNSASARQNGQQQNGTPGQSEAQRAAEQLKQAQQSLQSGLKQQNGSQLGELANKAEQLASQQQDFEQRLRRNFGQGEASQRTAEQMADEKHKMLDSFNQMQKDMQNTARSVAGTQPGVSKDLRDATGRMQQEEIGTRMEVTEEALRRGYGQLAVMREAPVTQYLNELKDQMKKLEGESAAQGAGTSPTSDDKSQIAMQQALNQTDLIRRKMEQLSRSRQMQQGKGQGQGERQGKPGQQGGQPGNENGQQPGQQNGQSQQASKGSKPGQPGQGQPGQGQPGQQGQGQQAGMGQQGSPGSPNGGGYGTNAGPRGGYAGGYYGGGQPFDPNSGGDTRMAPLPPNYSPEAAYSDVMRDIGRLRNTVGNDKDFARALQDLTHQAQEELDPRHMTNDGRLGSVIGAQAMSELDEVELVLRRKMQGSDSSARSTNPRNTPPGYADSVAEYYKRLSQQ